MQCGKSNCCDESGSNRISPSAFEYFTFLTRQQSDQSCTQSFCLASQKIERHRNSKMPRKPPPTDKRDESAVVSDGFVQKTKQSKTGSLSNPITSVQLRKVRLPHLYPDNSKPITVSGTHLNPHFCHRSGNRPTPQATSTFKCWIRAPYGVC